MLLWFRRRLLAGRPLARTQQRQHWLAGDRVEDVDGLKAVRVITGVEQRQLLATVNRIKGIVSVEDDALRHALEPVAALHAPQSAALTSCAISQTLRAACDWFGLSLPTDRRCLIPHGTSRSA